MRGAERAHVRDRERAADDLVGAELLAAWRASARSRISRAISAQPLAVGVADHRRDQTLEVEVDRDAEVDVAVHDERVAVDARVDVRVVVHDVAERADDERQVREREALLGLPRGLVRARGRARRARSRPDRRVDVRARRLRPHHVLGGAAADVVERDDLVARRARDRRGAGAAAARARRGGRGRGGAAAPAARAAGARPRPRRPRRCG